MNRRERYILLIILILIFLAYIFPIITDFQKQESVTIFVIDTFDDNLISHGDIVSSIIEREVPEFNIIKLNVREKDSYGLSRYYQALEQVYSYKMENGDQKVIVNISLGFYEADKYHEILIKNLHQSGIGIVAAAGNDDTSIYFYPSAFKNEVIAVASVDGNKKSSYSNFGEHIDICADGSFFTTISMPQFSSYRASGTSFAAPRVSAFLAKIMSVEPELSFDQAVGKLENLSVPLEDSLYEKGLLGEGKISNWKYLMQYNRNKLFYYYLLPTLIFLLITYLVIKKLGYIGIPYLILLLIVAGPFFVLIKDYILSNISKKMFTLDNLIYLIIFILFYIIIKIITHFEKYYLLRVYLLIIFVNFIFLNTINQLSVGLFIMTNISFIIIFYLFEKYILSKYKNSTKVKDLNQNNKKVVDNVKNNIVAAIDNDNTKLINELYRLYERTNKIHVKKAVIDILIELNENIIYSYLIKNANNYLLEKKLLNMISDIKDKIYIEDLLHLINDRTDLLEELLSNYLFKEIENQLKIEFTKKETNLRTLINIVLYYKEKSFSDFLLNIYNNYQKCGNRFLIFKTIIEIVTKEEKNIIIDKFKNDKCDIVRQEVEYYYKEGGQ